LTCTGIDALPSFSGASTVSSSSRFVVEGVFRDSDVVHSFKVVGPRLCVFAYEYFVFLGRVTNPSAKPPFLVDQFVSLSMASLLRPVRLGRPYQEQKVPGGIARKDNEARKPPPPPPPPNNKKKKK